MAATRTPGVTRTATVTSSSTSATAASALACALAPSLRSKLNSACGARCSRSTSTWRARQIGARVSPTARQRYLAQSEETCAASKPSASMFSCSSSTLAISSRIRCTTPRWHRSSQIASPTASSATTINRTLEVARTILQPSGALVPRRGRATMAGGIAAADHDAARVPRSPYPITWEEQDRLFPRLPAHLQPWRCSPSTPACATTTSAAWNGPGKSPFPRSAAASSLCPPTGSSPSATHVVILNDVGLVDHPGATRPASDLGVPVSRAAHRDDEQQRLADRRAAMSACARARVHDLRHTFACRLRAAGVSVEDRAALLGHADHSMAGHYASADVGRLLRQANLVLNRQETRTVLRVANGCGRGETAVERGPAAVPQLREDLVLLAQVIDFWRGWQDSNPRPLGS